MAHHCSLCNVPDGRTDYASSKPAKARIAALPGIKTYRCPRRVVDLNGDLIWEEILVRAWTGPEAAAIAGDAVTARFEAFQAAARKRQSRGGKGRRSK